MLTRLTILLFFVSTSLINAQIYTPSGTIQGASGNNNTGIGIDTPTHKLTIKGNHTDSNILLHSTGGTDATRQADLMLWASEPGLTYSGVGIGNNVSNYTTTSGGIKLLNTARGGSYIRLLDNSISFNTVPLSGADRQIISINLDGNIDINPTKKLHLYSDSNTTLKIANSDPSTFPTEIHLGGNGDFTKSAIISAPNAAGWHRQDLYFCLANGNNYSSVGLTDAAMTIKSYNSGQFGYVGIGTVKPDEKLTVKGKIHAEEVRIDLSFPAPDYVFANDYKLKTLQEVEAYIKQNRHLPEIPSAKEIEKNGLMLAEMNMSLLKKIEELTLYSIEQNKKIETQSKEIETLKDLVVRVTKIENKLSQK